jgi:DNA (cytosine-5)-methyltransferase 1
MTYTAIDVMGFAGGFTLGVVQAGFKLTGKRELPGGFGMTNCTENRALLGHDWDAQAGPAESWTVPSTTPDLTFGNPPCSGWSVMSSQKFRGADSPALACTWQFIEFAARTRAPVIIWESVQQAYTHRDGLPLMRALRERLEERTGQRYDLTHVLHNAYSVGGPAIRPRYFWVASQVPFGIEVPRPAYTPAFRDVIGDLEALGQTWHPQPYRAPAHPWAERLRSPSGLVDGHISERNPLTGRIRDLLGGVEWQPGESISTVARRYYQTHGELPKSFAGTAQKLIASDFAMGFTTPTRWREDNPARVITGAGPSLVVHPWRPRMLTHREVARILGFPDDWRILPLRKVGGLGLTWGKGITVDCGRWIASWARAALDGNPGEYAGEELGDRERVIDVTHSWKPDWKPRLPRPAVRDTVALAS